MRLKAIKRSAELPFDRDEWRVATCCIQKHSVAVVTASKTRKLQSKELKSSRPPLAFHKKEINYGADIIFESKALWRN
jgi:hypothetical protein